MADTIERLYKISVDGTAAIAQLNRIGDSTESLSKQFAEFGERIEKVTKLFGVGLGIAEVIEGLDKLKEKFTETIESMDETAKAAVRVGVSAEKLQELRYAATVSASSAEDLQRGLERLSANMTEIGKTSTDASRALKVIGVTSKDTADQALAKIADFFAKIPDGATKTATAMAIFGKEAGPSLLVMLNQGSKGIDTLAQKARELGVVLSDEVLKQAEQFNDQIGILKTLSGVGWTQAAGGMLPYLKGIAETLTEASKNGSAFKDIGDKIGQTLVYIAQAGIGTTQVLKTVAADFTFLKQIVTGDDIRDWPKIFEAWKKALTDIDTHARVQFASLKRHVEEAKAAIAAPPVAPVVDPKAKRELDEYNAKLKALADEAENARRAQEAAREADRLRTATAKAAADGIKAMTDEEKNYQDVVERDKSDAVLRARYDDTVALKLATDRATKALQDFNDAQRKARFDAEALNTQLEDMTLTHEQREDIAKRLLGPAPEESKKKVEDMSDMLKAFDDGFNGFVQSLSSGSVSVAQAFKGMVESIIADLLKLLAKKYILEFFFPGSSAGSTPKTQALGGAFDAGAVVPFAAGGIISSRVTMPLALMGEAGPEAVMPLKRGADGALGVRAATQAVNVQIHNYAGASISAQRGSSGELQVIVEATKKALAADVRRGGNDFSRAAESAWRLSRGAAAPF